MKSEDRDMRMKTLIIHVHGRVQGVGYRYFTIHKAEDLGITGTVKNEPDGHVSILAQGDEDKLDRFIQSLYKGPTLAYVTKITTEEYSSDTKYKDFKVVF
jgi:acylphosphatase